MNDSNWKVFVLTRAENSCNVCFVDDGWLTRTDCDKNSHFSYLIPFCENRDYFSSNHSNNFSLFFTKSFGFNFAELLIQFAQLMLVPFLRNSEFYCSKFWEIFHQLSQFPLSQYFFSFPNVKYLLHNFNHVIQHPRLVNNWAERCLCVFFVSNYQLDRISIIHSYQLITIIHFDNVITKTTLKNLS